MTIEMCAGTYMERITVDKNENFDCYSQSEYDKLLNMSHVLLRLLSNGVRTTLDFVMVGNWEDIKEYKEKQLRQLVNSMKDTNDLVYFDIDRL